LGEIEKYLNTPMSNQSILEDISTDYFWEDTLPEFLTSSNEDEIIINLFREWVVPSINWQKFDSHLNWLEIGCGDFYKTYNILNLMKNFLSTSSLKLQVIEPSSVWVKNFHNKYDNLTAKSMTVHFMPSKLEEYIAFNNKHNFDFISIIHVLYEKRVTYAFLKLLDDLISNKQSCTVFISIESENSDFALIRNELSESGFSVPESKHTFLESEFERRQLYYLSKETEGKKCQIDLKTLINNNDYWLYPFMLGISKTTFNSWDKSKRNYAIEIIQNRINSDEEYLSVNDKIFLIKTHE
jgi:hypothetical protein